MQLLIGTKSQFQIGGENGSGLRETIPMVDLWVDTVHGVHCTTIIATVLLVRLEWALVSL